jgi:hypothetical protein
MHPLCVLPTGWCFCNQRVLLRAAAVAAAGALVAAQSMCAVVSCCCALLLLSRWMFPHQCTLLFLPLLPHLCVPHEPNARCCVLLLLPCWPHLLLIAWSTS